MKKIKGYIAKLKLYIAKRKGVIPKNSIMLYRAIKKAGLK
jgi:hypothetical protein